MVATDTIVLAAINISGLLFNALSLSASIVTLGVAVFAVSRYCRRRSIRIEYKGGKVFSLTVTRNRNSKARNGSAKRERTNEGKRKRK